MMKRREKTDAILAWAKTWPRLDEYLKLNAILTQEDEASLNPIGTEKVGDRYIDGTPMYLEYTFMLKIVLPWSDGYDAVNAEAQLLVEEWMDWVDAQYPDNVPALDGVVEKIEAVASEPTITVFQDESLAEYNFICKITYNE